MASPFDPTGGSPFPQWNPAGDFATGTAGSFTPQSQTNAAMQPAKSSGNPFADVLNHVSAFNSAIKPGPAPTAPNPFALGDASFAHPSPAIPNVPTVANEKGYGPQLHDVGWPDTNYGPTLPMQPGPRPIPPPGPPQWGGPSILPIGTPRPIVPPGPPQFATPALEHAMSFPMTATGPKGHKIGSHDGGATWFDAHTGRRMT